MRLSAKHVLQLPAHRLDAIIVIIAVVLASVLVLLEQGRINDDGVLYLEAAKYFARHDWDGGRAFYAWPFYSILVAMLSNIGGISLEASANTLSVVFFAIAAYAFARLIRLAGGSNLTVAAGTVLLFSNPYIVGDVLPLIWRDQGFWALFLTSLGYFIRFYRDGRLLDALIWQGACIVAVLFRTEGLLFLVLTPLLLLFKSEIGFGARAVRLLSAYSIGLVVTTTVTAGLLTGLIEPDVVPMPVQIILTYVRQISLQMSEGLYAKAAIFGDQVLGKFLDDYAMHGLVLTLFAVIFGKITGTASWLSFLLAAAQSRLQGARMNRDAQVILCWTGIIAILNMLITLLANFLLAGRYVVPFALIVIVFAAFSLAALCQRSSRAFAGDTAVGPRWLLPLIALTLCVHAYMIFKPKGQGYTYEKDAVAWVREYARNDDRIFYDNARLRYYAGLPVGERGIGYWDTVKNAIADGSLLEHDFLVVHIERNSAEQESYIAEQLGYRPVREFTARNKVKIVVFARDSAPAQKSEPGRG
jgi:hypothetical protein